MHKEIRIKNVEPEIPSYCVCPNCQIRQPFKKAKEHWKTVKTLNLERVTLLHVHMIYAKCQNKKCPAKAFALPVPGIEKYQRSTIKTIQEGISGLVDDNSTTHRIAQRLNRSFNTTGSKSAIDRWKHRKADKYDIKEIISRLEFSGALSLDEYMPRGATNYEMIAGDAKKIRILYIEAAPITYGRGVTESFLQKLGNLGLRPYVVIFDFFKAFPKQVQKVWPGVLMQYDYFHIKQTIIYYLRNALIQFRQSLKGKREKLHREELWEHKWSLLKDMDKWKPKEHFIVSRMMQIYQGTIIEKVLLMKEQVWDIFENSRTKEEAYAKRDRLLRESWWQDSWHLSQIIKFLGDNSRFVYMTTYLEDPRVPRCGHSETLISIWRRIEAARRGFKTDKGRLDHLKLFQIYKYLGGSI